MAGSKNRSVEYTNLLNELESAGAPTSAARKAKGTDFEYSNPVNIFVNTNISCKPYKEILIRYLPLLEGMELEMVVRALSEKGLTETTDCLLALFEDHRHSQNELLLWAVSNALSIIDDRSKLIQIRQICRNRSFGGARQMLIHWIGKFKDNETFDVLKNCLSDESVRGHAIEAVGRSGRHEAIELVEKVQVQKGKYEYKAKQTALRRLNRKFRTNQSQ